MKEQLQQLEQQEQACMAEEQKLGQERDRRQEVSARLWEEWKAVNQAQAGGTCSLDHFGEVSRFFQAVQVVCRSGAAYLLHMLHLLDPSALAGSL